MQGLRLAFSSSGGKYIHLPNMTRRDLKGQVNRGNRTESLCERNLPLRGSLRGRVFRGFQRVSEVFRDFQRFSEIFQRLSEVLSETLSEADFPLRGSQSCCPLNFCPLNFLPLNFLTGRPGYRAMEMNGGSSTSYLTCTPDVPLFGILFNRGGSRRAFRLPGEGGDHVHRTVEPSPGHIRCRCWECKCKF